MKKKKTLVITALIATVVVVGAVLLGSSAMSEALNSTPGANGIATVGAGAEPAAAKTLAPSVTTEALVENPGGYGKPSAVTILCVEGAAFLYTWENHGYAGGPTTTRFTEQDSRCASTQ